MLLPPGDGDGDAARHSRYGSAPSTHAGAWLRCAAWSLLQCTDTNASLAPPLLSLSVESAFAVGKHFPPAFQNTACLHLASKLQASKQAACPATPPYLRPERGRSMRALSSWENRHLSFGSSHELPCQHGSSAEKRSVLYREYDRNEKRGRGGVSRKARVEGGGQRWWWQT